MTENLFDQMTAAIKALDPTKKVGRVIGVSAGLVQVGGLSGDVHVGDRARIFMRRPLFGEVVRLDAQGAHLVVDGPPEGTSIGDRVTISRPPRFAPDNSWIGRVIDPDGQPIDGRPLLPGLYDRAIVAAPPPPHRRRAMGKRLETGLAVFNTILPIVQGQRIGLFAGSGVGKSTLLADFARSVTADVIVIALVGERGREVRHFVDDVLGPEGMQRSVVVAATSDQAPQVRRRCALAATSVAEYFRDQGKQVLLMIDSVTRFCEAHREVAVASGESANLRGFPASTGAAISGLCERAGPGHDDGGDITAIFSVLVAGSDMEEPIADMLRGVLDGHVVLERDIAERGRFPAVSILKSVSRSLPAAATDTENALIAQARAHLGRYDRAEMMIQSGLYAQGTDKDIDAAIACVPALEEFLSIKDGRGTLAHFAKLRQAVSNSSMRMVQEDLKPAPV